MIQTTAYDALRNSRLGAELSDDQCQVLAQQLVPRRLADGEVLVREGTSDNHLYVLVAGVLAVARGAGTSEETQLSALSAGDLVGELSFLDDNVHYASVVSRGISQVFGLERSAFEALLESDAQIVYRVLRAIVRRVHQAQHRLSAQSVELMNYIYKQHGRY